MNPCASLGSVSGMSQSCHDARLLRTLFNLSLWGWTPGAGVGTAALTSRGLGQSHDNYETPRGLAYCQVGREHVTVHWNWGAIALHLSFVELSASSGRNDQVMAVAEGCEPEMQFCLSSPRSSEILTLLP